MNYQLETDKYIAALCEKREPLALHSCCAVCSSYVIDYLSAYFDITVFYCNPNIFPRGEYEKRKSEQQRLIREAAFASPVAFFEDEYDREPWLCAVRGLEHEPEGGARCEKCFEFRLTRTAGFAAAQGIPLFCSTLTVSPHKDAQKVNEAGLAAAAAAGIRWLPSDFKKRDGFLKSNRLADKYGIYRQSYCGCEFAMP